MPVPVPLPCRLFAAVAALALSSIAGAQELRSLCPERPGLGTPPCIVDQGHLQVELGLGQWTRETMPDARTDTIVAGELLARLGIAHGTEVRFEWDAYGHARIRDRGDGTITRMAGTGDVTLGFKQSLTDPDGKELTVSILPEVSVPTGGRAIGAGTWSAAVLLPARLRLGDEFRVELTPEVDAAANESGTGRHLAYSGTFGLVAKLGEHADVEAEVQARRDRDPEMHETQLLAALSYDYRPMKWLQLDVRATAGLNRYAPDVELSFGISRKFR